MNFTTELVKSYGRCKQGTSNVYRPSTVDEVNQVFQAARASGGASRIVIRGAGHSFDGQAVHDGDDGSQIVLSSTNFQNNLIQFNADNTVTLGAGVSWEQFVNGQIAAGGPIRIPASIQTGRATTIAGSLSGNCLSRFSGLSGKESACIQSFNLLTPQSGAPFTVTATSDAELFNAVIGGHGLIGFVTDATYKTIEVDGTFCARSNITLHKTFADLIQRQMDLIQSSAAPRAISSAWFTSLLPVNDDITGGAFESYYAPFSQPPLAGFPLYHDIDGGPRRLIEVSLARESIGNFAVHEALFLDVIHNKGQFEDDLMDFWFFMDGDTSAKLWYEQNTGLPFPIVQQTYVVPVAQTEAFSLNCMRKMRNLRIRPTECDMLFVKADQSLMSANYKMDGFAVTLGFEWLTIHSCPGTDIPDLLLELSQDCLLAGGRIHLPKGLYVDPSVFRQMFTGPDNQIGRFEAVKRQHDPEKLIGNQFSDTFFRF